VTKKPAGRKQVTTEKLSESSGVDVGDQVILHVFTRKESMRRREAHVATRVRSYVKNVLFRNIKFVNSEQKIQQAMQLVMKFENIKEHKKMEFHQLYESVFNDALNTKRSACEQAGSKIVVDTVTRLASLVENGEEELFTMEELCKLRRATTPREIDAFHWFFCEFLECVCGRKLWGAAKFITEVSKATLNNASPAKIVTRSDEAFGLLLFENYRDKWLAMAEDAKEPAVADGGDKKKKTERRRGKFTGANEKTGQCKWGGWTTEGMKRFNELFNLVSEDRKCPQAAAMETELLQFCQAAKKAATGDDGAIVEGQGGGAAKLPTNLEPPVDAVWDFEEV
jgi:hypothetical protein